MVMLTMLCVVFRVMLVVMFSRLGMVVLVMMRMTLVLKAPGILIHHATKPATTSTTSPRALNAMRVCHRRSLFDEGVIAMEILCFTDFTEIVIRANTALVPITSDWLDTTPITGDTGVNTFSKHWRSTMSGFDSREKVLFVKSLFFARLT
jgi:hypothetical protein